MKAFTLICLSLLLAACHDQKEASHDCKAIAKAIFSRDDSGLRDQYDKLMYDSLKDELKGSVSSSYARIYTACKISEAGS